MNSMEATCHGNMLRNLEKYVKIITFTLQRLAPQLPVTSYELLLVHLQPLPLAACDPPKEHWHKLQHERMTGSGWWHRACS